MPIYLIAGTQLFDECTANGKFTRKRGGGGGKFDDKCVATTMLAGSWPTGRARAKSRQQQVDRSAVEQIKMQKSK